MSDYKSVVPSLALQAMVDADLSRDLGWAVPPTSLPDQPGEDRPTLAWVQLQRRVRWSDPPLVEQKLVEALEERARAARRYQPPKAPSLRAAARWPELLARLLQHAEHGMESASYPEWYFRARAMLDLIQHAPNAAELRVAVDQRQLDGVLEEAKLARLSMVSPDTVQPVNEETYRRRTMVHVEEAKRRLLEFLGTHLPQERDRRVVKHQARVLASASRRQGEPVRPVAVGLADIKSSLKSSSEALLTQEDTEEHVERLTARPKDEEDPAGVEEGGG